MNKILIGNKCDWDDKRAVSVQQGRELADEFGLRFLETSAKANEGVEEAFFTLARDIKLRLIDTQEPAAGSAANSAALGGAKGNVSVGGGAPKAGGGCC